VVYVVQNLSFFQNLKHAPMKKERDSVDIEQQKLMKLFKMIWMLKPPRGKTVQQLVEDMDISRASVYRYLDFLDETHFFKVVKDKNRRIIYDSFDEKGSVTIKFGEDELNCISDALTRAFPEHDLARGIQAKMFQHARYGLQSQSSVLSNTPLVIRDLHQAMTDRVQVAINYFSANNGTLDKRIVEPLEFTELHRYLIVYDAKAYVKITNLKTSRIQSVEILHNKRSTQTANSIKGIDVFDIACYEEQHALVLNMTPLAYRLMMEEYPRTEAHFEVLNGGNTVMSLRGIEATEGFFQYQFKATVYSLLPIARFIMGLPGHIKIVESAALVADIQKKMGLFCAF
jgi:predicted DNA-binding transcriptional regulator YafY